MLRYAQQQEQQQSLSHQNSQSTRIKKGNNKPNRKGKKEREMLRYAIKK
jgi:hypothetical protein